jgi:hypothetical protein
LVFAERHVEDLERQVEEILAAVSIVLPMAEAYAAVEGGSKGSTEYQAYLKAEKVLLRHL